MKETAEERKTLKISVRNLVEFILRSGDIDDRVGGADSMQAMQAGARIHRKLQKRAGSDYHAEVPLKFVVSYDEYDLVIEGRADGIIYDEDELLTIEEQASDGVSSEQAVFSATIDEIKGMYQDVMAYDEPILVHLAQAKCYAFIFAEKYSLKSIDVQMTYVNLDTEEIKQFTESFTFEALEEWFQNLISMYKKWSDFEIEHKKIRQESIAKLEFPFEYREGQKQLVSDVYRSIIREKILFAQAPTGSGKTISTIFPAVKAVGEGYGDRIFYLTAKNVTRVVARDTFKILEEKGYEGKTVLITAKDKICPHDERKCNPDDCPYAKGHFDRVNDAVYDFLQTGNVFDRDIVYEYAIQREVCPFEFCLDVSSWCDNIICDYNYVFDPNVCLKRFFAEGIRGDYLFLVDEAHNLVERARNMYSVTIVKEDVLFVKKILKNYGKNLERTLERMNKTLLGWKKECMGNRIMLDDIDVFIYEAMNAASEIEKFLEKKIRMEFQEEILDFYFTLRDFLSLSEGMGEGYRIYCDFMENGEFAFHLYCVDPSERLQERLNRGRATVFFSATLLPVNYYKKLLCKEEPYAIYAKSIFDPAKRRIFVGNSVTTKYTRRSAKEYERFAKYIDNIVSAKIGNYMVFFPSYKFMEEVLFYMNMNKDREIIVQESRMTEDERDLFLSKFEEERSNTLIAFCVMGGVFSEGIDLTNEKLIGAIIVGTGLPQVSNEREILKDYFDSNGENGFLFSYLYPGMNKVEQAAGRVIRTTEDVGIVALLDERFLFSDYRNTFPREWEDFMVCNEENIKDAALDFWSEQSSKKI